MSAQQPKDEMSFLDHLEELRWHLIRSVIAILIVAIVAFIFKDFIFDVLLFGPKQKDFITYRWFCSISQTLGQGNSFCIDELPFRIQSRTMAGQFSAHLWTSILAGFILAFPYIIFEFWKFISPGLYEKERKKCTRFYFYCLNAFFL
jgi:sec-independent protein translocase protein TatC